MARRITVWLTVVAIALTTFTPLASAAYPQGGDGEPATAEPSDGAAYAFTIGEHETHFPSHGRYAGRAHNVRLAAENLDGVVLAPGAELSFNEIVGHRTEENGFDYAPVIANGQIRRGIGGGVCQVATTLHVAATKAGLTVIARRAHSRPASYVDPGMDATVVDGRVDYVIANPYDFPIAIRTKTTADDDLRIVVTGAEHVEETAFRTQRVRLLPHGERRVEDPTLAPGQEVVEQRGRDGLVVRVTTERDGESHSEVIRYAPAPRIIHVGGTAAQG